MRLRVARRAVALVLARGSDGELRTVSERQVQPGDVLDVAHRLIGAERGRDAFTATDGGLVSLPAGSWHVDFHHEVRERLRAVVADVVQAGAWTDKVFRRTRRVLDCALAVHPEVIPDHPDYPYLVGHFIDAVLGGDVTALPPALADHVRRFRGR